MHTHSHPKTVTTPPEARPAAISLIDILDRTIARARSTARSASVRIAVLELHDTELNKRYQFCPVEAAQVLFTAFHLVGVVEPDGDYHAADDLETLILFAMHSSGDRNLPERAIWLLVERFCQFRYDPEEFGAALTAVIRDGSVVIDYVESNFGTQSHSMIFRLGTHPNAVTTALRRLRAAVTRYEDDDELNTAKDYADHVLGRTVSKPELAEVFNIANEEDLRDLFWEDHPQFSAERRPNKTQNDYRTDIRVAFVDYVDAKHRDRQISDDLAQSATL